MRRPDLEKILATINAVTSAKRAIVRREATAMIKLNRYLVSLGYRVEPVSKVSAGTPRVGKRRGRPSKKTAALGAHSGQRRAIRRGRPPKSAHAA